MASETVSASVDVNVKRLAGMYIKRAGRTPSDVVREVWNHIAATGEIPSFDDSASRQQASSSFRKLMDLRNEVPCGTPLDEMDAAGIRRELMNRDV